MGILVSRTVLNQLILWQKAFKKTKHKILSYSVLIEKAMKEVLKAPDPFVGIEGIIDSDDNDIYIYCRSDSIKSVHILIDTYRSNHGYTLTESQILLQALPFLKYDDSVAGSLYSKYNLIKHNAEGLGKDISDRDIDDMISDLNSSGNYSETDEAISDLSPSFNTAKDYSSTFPHKKVIQSEMNTKMYIPVIIYLSFSWAPLRLLWLILLLSDSLYQMRDLISSNSEKDCEVFIPMFGSHHNKSNLYNFLFQYTGTKKHVYGSKDDVVVYKTIRSVYNGFIINVDSSFIKAFLNSVGEILWFNWNVVTRLKSKSSLIVYILMNNTKYGINLTIKEWKNIFGCPNKYNRKDDFVKVYIKGSKELLDAYSPISFIYRNKATMLSLKPISVYSAIDLNTVEEQKDSNKRNSLFGMIGKDLYDKIKSFGFTDEDLLNEADSLSLLWEAGVLEDLVRDYDTLRLVYKGPNSFIDMMSIYLQDELIKS